MKLVPLALVALMSVANGCGGDDPPGSCRNLSGNWSLSGGCPLSSCVVSQTGCSVSIACNDGTTLSGTASSTNLTFSNSTTRCQGTVDTTSGAAPTISGSCSQSAGSC